MRFLPAITWLILSLVLLCAPGSVIPKYPWLEQIYADKWVHIILFFVLCFLFSYPFRFSNNNSTFRRNWFLLILLCGMAYGTSMEFVQKYWIPNRSFEIWDIVADSIGCLLAYFYAVKKFMR